MMSKLKISDTLSLALDFVTSTQAILAKKGSGKSYTASVQAEELLEAKQQVVVVDPTGAWSGLRSSADGKSAGYSIAVLGGEHADVPLETTAGEVIGDAIAGEHFSAILDLSLFRKGEALRFMATFLETLYRKNRDALHLFIDEADVVAPQRTFGPDEARVLGATEDIVRRGRIRGIGCTLITQRPQVLNKNVLSQVDMLTALRMNHPKDLGAIDEWVAVHGDQAEAKRMMESLPSLPIGDAWVWAPAQDLFKRVTIRKRRTFDSGRTPKAGERAATAKVLAAVDLTKLGAAIAGTVERAKAVDPKSLRARIAELEKQVAAKPTAKVERVEVSVVKPADLERIEKLIAKADKVGQPMLELLADLNDEIETLRMVVLERLESQQPAQSPKSNGVHPTAPVRSTPPPKPTVHERVASMPGAGRPTPAGQKILDAALLVEQLGLEPDRNTLAAWVGAHPNSKGYGNNLGTLRSSGLLDGFQLTDAGRKLAHSSTPSIETIMRPLKPKQRELLEAVRQGVELERIELAGLLGVHPNSKSFGNNVGALRTRGLLTASWPIRTGKALEAL